MPNRGPIKFLVLAATLFASVFPAHAELETRTVEYRHGDIVLEGYLAYDAAKTDKRPGILVVHEWKGLNDYAKGRAEQLAAMGYVAFAADMYGKGVYAKDHEEAGRLSGAFRSDRQMTRDRITAALEVLKAQPGVDLDKIGAIGYCFGGMTVLELARSGADIRGVASFHGSLGTPSPAAPGAVKARVIVFHGADDPHIQPDQVEAFEKEMQAAGVVYQVIQYPGAVHSFTVPEAGDDPSKGAAYNAEADRKSWQKMKEFFAQLFG